MDWAQTLSFRQQGDREGNPLLGPFPSEGRINTLIGLGLIANGAALLLPKKPRRLWYAAVLAIEAYAIVHNLRHTDRISSTRGLDIAR